MASTPQWKCYLSGEYMAATKHPEDAAILMAAWGSSGEVRRDHTLVVWREGREEISAGESADVAAQIMIRRHDEHVQARLAKMHPTRLGDALKPGGAG
jgi:hypothetical protein